MRAERLGSYSMAATLAGTPILLRLKSITRYACLAPPPRKREEIKPRLLRPPVRCFPSTSDFSGCCLVISSRDTTVVKRRVAVVGLYFFIAITLDLRVLRHLLTRLEPHVGFFPVGSIPGKSAATPELAHLVDGAHL